jgi:hypothetical protein
MEGTSAQYTTHQFNTFLGHTRHESKANLARPNLQPHATACVIAYRNVYAIGERATTMTDEKKKREIVEELTLKGQDVLERVKELVQQGNVRKLIVRKSDGQQLFELPLTGAVVGASALVVFATPLAFLAGVVAFLAEVKLEVVREVDDDDSEDEDDGKRKRIEIQ